MPRGPLASRVQRIKVVIEEVNTSVKPPVAHARETTLGGNIIINLRSGPGGIWVTPNVGETWWIQYHGTRWTLLTRVDDERGGGDTPSSPKDLKLSFQVAEQETELIYRAVLQFNSSVINANLEDISHYLINWVACDETGKVRSKANQYSWYPNKTTDGTDEAVDPDPTDKLDYFVLIPTPVSNPKTTFYKARVRAVSKSLAMGDWSEWTTPTLPIREEYNLPPVVEDVSLDFTVTETNNKSLIYNAIVRFKDIGYWDLPEGDFVDDIDRYEIQMQPLQTNNQTVATLHNSINNTTTSIRANFATGIGTASILNQYIIIDEEVMHVDSISLNGPGPTPILNVTRGQQFTNPAKHSVRRAIQIYTGEESTPELIPAPNDQMGTMDSPKAIEDLDDQEKTWPLIGTLLFENPEPEEQDTTDFIGPEDTVFKVESTNLEFLQFVNINNLPYGIYLQIDSEQMKIISFNKVPNVPNQYSFTVERGQQDTEASNHNSGSNVYIQNWIPFINVESSIWPEATKIRVATFGSFDLPNDFSIKIDNEIMRVTKKKYIETNILGHRVYDFKVYRGLQNTAAKAHKNNVTGYYLLGNYYTHIFTAIPEPNKYWWRARVRAVDRFNRKGLWSDWTDSLKATLAASTLPPAPSEISLNFVRNHKGREWSTGCEVNFNTVQYEIEGGDTLSDVAGYQVRLFHSDGAYLKDSITSGTTSIINIVEPPRSGNLQRQLSAIGTGYILLTGKQNNIPFYEFMYVESSTDKGTYWEYKVQRGQLNTVGSTFTVDIENPTYVFYFPPQASTDTVTKNDPPKKRRKKTTQEPNVTDIEDRVYSSDRQSVKFDLVRKQWWYLAQARTIDVYNRVSAWSNPTDPGTASDTTRPPAPFNLSVLPYDNKTIKIDWDAPVEPGMNIPNDLLTLLNNNNSIDSADFEILSNDISFFKVQLWSEDPHQEVPLNTKSFGINTITKSGSTITFTVDAEQNQSIPVTSMTTSTVNGVTTVTLTTGYNVADLVVDQPIRVQNVQADLNTYGSQTFTVKSIGTRSISYDLETPLDNDILQTTCSGTIYFDEDFRNWFQNNQVIYIDKCLPEILNGKQTITAITAYSFSINLSTSETEFSADDAIVRPFDATESADYYATYPIHYFVRPYRAPKKNNPSAQNLTDVITAGHGDICYVKSDGNNNGFWKLEGVSPRNINSWKKIPDAEFKVSGLLFFDQYVSTTSRTIPAENLPNKVWARVCAVDDSGNASAWIAAGPFFTNDIYKPKNVILDFHDPVPPVYDAGSPSSTADSTFDNGLFNALDSSFYATIDANLKIATVPGYNQELQGTVNDVDIRWDEIIDSDLSVKNYEVELQSGRLFGQLWETSMRYWGTKSKDIIYGGLSSDMSGFDDQLNAVQLANVPAPEFYIRIDSEIIKVNEILLDWEDEQETFINARYDIERAVLGTTAASHDAGAIIYSVQVESIKVLELSSPVDAVPFDITIGNEKLRVFERELDEDTELTNLYVYNCLRDRNNAPTVQDFEHDGINFRIPIFDSLDFTKRIVSSAIDAVDANDFANTTFSVLDNNLWYRSRVRSVFENKDTSAWSLWTFWADPTDFIKPFKPVVTAAFNEEGNSLNISWIDAYTTNNPYEPTIFNNIASKNYMTELNARLGDIAVVNANDGSLKAYTLVFNNSEILNNWKQTLVPLAAIGTSDERIIPEGADKIGGSVQETDYYEVQVSRVPKEGKTVNTEGSIGSLLTTLTDGVGNTSIDIAPLKKMKKFPVAGDKLQILGRDLITASALIKGNNSKYEVQSIKLATVPNITGKWKVKFNSVTSSEIDYNATATQVRTALLPLFNSLIGTVTVSTSDKLTLKRHGLANGDIISFNSVIDATGLTQNINYYVVQTSRDTFKVSATLSGAPVDVTTSGSATFNKFVVSKPVANINEWKIKFLSYGSQNLLEVFGDSLVVGYESKAEIVEIAEDADSKDWGTSKVTLKILRNNGGTFVHPAGSIVKWIDPTAGDFANNDKVSFEYIYLWQQEPITTANEITYAVENTIDFLYAVRVRARDAAGNSSAWSEINFSPEGLPIPNIVDLNFTELGDYSDQINADLIFEGDITPGNNVTGFIPELMPSLQTRLLNSLTASSTDVVVSTTSEVPDPTLPNDINSPGVGPYFAFIENEVVLVTARTGISNWPNVKSKPNQYNAYRLTVVRAQLDTDAEPHTSGTQFEWFYHPTEKQIEDGVSYSGSVAGAEIDISTGVLVWDYLAEFTASFEGVVQVGRWYQARVKSIAGPISSEWSEWSLPVRALHANGFGASTTKPNPVRNLVVDVDSREINVSWLAPLPTTSISDENRVASVTVGSIISYNGYGVSLTDDEWLALDIDKTTVQYAKVTTTTAHNFYGYNSFISDVKIPSDEIKISGAYAPFNGSFPVLWVIDSTNFVIPIIFDDSASAPTSYPIAGANQNAVVSLSDPDTPTGTNISHYIVEVKRAKSANSTIADFNTIPPATKPKETWSPSLMKETNVKETYVKFKLARPAGELPYFARVIAVNTAGETSNPTYAVGDRIRPPKPSILKVTVFPSTQGNLYGAEIAINATGIITDIDIDYYLVQWFVSPNEQEKPEEFETYLNTTINKAAVDLGKTVKITSLIPKQFLFVRVAAHNIDGNISDWTLWRRKKIVLG